MAIQWGNLQTPNYFAAMAEGVDAGRKLRQEREVRRAANLFAQDPEAGANAFIAAGRPEAAAAMLTASSGVDKFKGRRAAQPFLEGGDYAGAAKAAAPHDLDLAKSLSEMDKDALDRNHALGKRGAAILMAASNLSDPGERRAYIDENAAELVKYGMPQERIAAYDVQNPQKMRADAGKFMELGDLAGKISVEKFGDYAVTYQTDPIRGTRAVGKTEIPETRAERRQREEFEYRQQHDAEEMAYKRELDGKQLSIRERELAIREKIAQDPHSSPAKVMGPIFAKLAAGQELTSGEAEAMRFYKLDPITANALGDDGGVEDYGEGVTSPPPATAPRAPARPAGAGGLPDRARAQLREGQPTTFANGQTWTLRNGQPVQVK